MNKPKMGQRLAYTGEYDPQVSEAAKYPPGVVVGFRGLRSPDPKVTVRLDSSPDELERLGVEALYADWPLDQVRPVPAHLT